jgi:hypothetical protein
VFTGHKRSSIKRSCDGISGLKRFRIGKYRRQKARDIKRPDTKGPTTKHPTGIFGYENIRNISYLQFCTHFKLTRTYAGPFEAGLFVLGPLETGPFKAGCFVGIPMEHETSSEYSIVDPRPTILKG